MGDFRKTKGQAVSLFFELLVALKRAVVFDVGFLHGTA